MVRFALKDSLLIVSQENALDNAFIQLGIDTPNVNHPVMMTERLSSNLHSRACVFYILVCVATVLIWNSDFRVDV